MAVVEFRLSYAESWPPGDRALDGRAVPAGIVVAAERAGLIRRASTE